jgi:hypothetical protein
MARQTLTEEIAVLLLAKEGLAIIWRLHTDAATLYRIGNPTAAAIFIQIADAAEEAWLRRETVAGE